MKEDFNKALIPVKKAFSFTFNILGKATPYAVKLLFLPVHGINRVIHHTIDFTNPYNGAKITKVSNFIGNNLAKIPYKISDKIRNM